MTVPSGWDAAGARPAGADGAAGGESPALTVLYTVSTGCASCREDIFPNGRGLFSCKMTKEAAIQNENGGPCRLGRRFLPLRAGRVNDKKVNEENSKIHSGAERGCRPLHAGKHCSCIQDAPLGYKIPLFTWKCKPIFNKNATETASKRIFVKAHKYMSAFLPQMPNLCR